MAGSQRWTAAASVVSDGAADVGAAVDGGRVGDGRGAAAVHTGQLVRRCVVPVGGRLIDEVQPDAQRADQNQRDDPDDHGGEPGPALIRVLLDPFLRGGLAQCGVTRLGDIGAGRPAGAARRGRGGRRSWSRRCRRGAAARCRHRSWWRPGRWAWRSPARSWSRPGRWAGSLLARSWSRPGPPAGRRRGRSWSRRGRRPAVVGRSNGAVASGSSGMVSSSPPCPTCRLPVHRLPTSGPPSATTAGTA